MTDFGFALLIALGCSVPLIVFAVVCAIRDYKDGQQPSQGEINSTEHKTTQTHSSNNPIEAMIEEVSPILLRLLRGFSKPDKEDYDRITIECRIFTLQYFRFFIGDSYEKFAKEYEAAVMETYRMATKYGFSTLEQFADYFSDRCVQYFQLHYSIFKKSQEGDKGVPVEYMGFRFLICIASLKPITDKHIQQSMFAIDNDFFVLLSSSQDVMHACNCIHSKFADYIDEESLEDEDSDEDVYYDEEEREVAKLLQDYSKEDAIDIVTERLSEALDIRKKEARKSLETYNKIATYCKMLDILSPLDKPHRYSNIKDVSFLVEILTIEYNYLNDAGKAVLKLATRAKVRGSAMIEIESGPQMNIDGNKLLREADMYNEASLHILNYKRTLGIAAMARKIVRIPEKKIKSSLTYLIDGYVLGLIHEGKLHLTPEFPIDSLKGPFHLYTYLWLEDIKILNYEKYKSIIKYAMTSEYFYHIWNSDKFSDLTENEAAVKSFCYMVASQGSNIFFNEGNKKILMSSFLAKIPYPFRIENILQNDMSKLPIISFIRGDKVNTYKGNEAMSILRKNTI